MAFIDRLKEARKKSGLTQEKLAKKIGVAKSTYTGYEKGNSEPNMCILSKIMESLNVDANYLYQDEVEAMHETRATVQEMEHLVKKYRLLDPEWKEAVDTVLDIGYRKYEADQQAKQARSALQSPPEQPEPDKVVYITKWFPMPMSAGTGQPAGSDEPEELELTKRPPRGTSYIAPVSGNSMEPTYHDGDKLFIRSCEEIEPGQIGVFLMDGQQWVKELGDGVLISHNEEEYSPIPMREDIRCQGLVLGVCDESYFE